jgi:superfamily I DNA and RNA helicase
MHVISGAVDRSKATARKIFVSFFEAFSADGITYAGYPLLDTPNGAVSVDGLFLSRRHTPVVFLFHTGTDAASLRNVEESQDAIYSAFYARLVRHAPLRSRRDLRFKVEVVTFAPFMAAIPERYDTVLNEDGLKAFLEEVETDVFQQTDGLFDNVIAVVQAFEKRATPNRKVPADESKRYARHLAFIDSQTSQLDVYQNRAIVETTEGPQRIRGLAGSGKTVVLASKAAYLHASDPDLDIVLTFYTKSLYGFLQDQVRKYYRLYTNSLEEPNWDKLRIMHAWGNKSLPGIYREVATRYNQKYYDFAEALGQFGYDGPFKGICDILNKAVDGSVQLADVVIIDEAQDLPQTFFEIVHKVTRDPKRIVWAYDELQKLDSIETVPPANVLFGNDAKGNPRVQLTNPNQDIVLPICYRNPKEVLTSAHAFGFGIYSKEGLIQMIDDSDLWSDIGYALMEGECKAGHPVRLARTEKSSPSFMSAHTEFSEPLKIRTFDDEYAQAEWIATRIKKLLDDEGLLHTDIMVIHPNPLTAKRDFKTIQRALAKVGVENHLTGSTFSDDFFIDGSICLTHIFRAKGNEAAYVFLIDSQFCATGGELIKRRNALFTAITRSRAWVAVCGYGESMKALSDEYKQVKDENFTLKFKWPSAAALEQMRRLHRELTNEEKQARKRAEKSAQDLMAALASGNLDAADLDPEIRNQLRKLL